MRSHLSLFSLCLLVALVGASCAPERSAGVPPNVLLITVDTLRPDALGWVTGGRATPAMDRLAREGFRFPAAVAPAPLTFPSHAAIFTGILPRRLGLRDNGQVLGSGARTITETLKENGYATAAFISGYPLAREFGLDRGFDAYDDALSPSDDQPERPAAATTDAALAWIRSARSPWFVWIHYYDPHFPYQGSYAAEVDAVDQAIKTLRETTASSVNMLTIFAADHGESLGEHGEGTHGFFVYDSTVLVPLVFHFPGRIEAGESGAPARLIDVAPTMADLLGLRPLDGIDGVTLRPSLTRQTQTIPPAFVESYQPWTSYGWSPLQAVRTERWKLIAAPRPELYDLRADPSEGQNVFDGDHRSLRELESLRRRVLALPAIVSPGSTDPEALAKLRALGYVGAGAGSGEPPGAGLRDPKDGLVLREILTRGDLALRQGHPAAAVSPFDDVLRQDPGNRFALLRSATALLALGRRDEAIARLERTVRLDAGRADARAVLANALLEAGRLDAATEHSMELVRLQPRNAAAWTTLGNSLGRSRRFGEAVEAFARAAELEPREGMRMARLAFAQHAAGRVDDAVTSLQRAAAMWGGDEFPHSGALGILLVQLGRRDQAVAWLSASRPEEGDYGQARFELARIEAEAGRETEARRALEEALAAAPALRALAELDPRLGPLLR